MRLTSKSAPALSIANRPLVVNFKFKTATTEDSRFAEVSIRFFKIAFCPTST